MDLDFYKCLQCSHQISLFSLKESNIYESSIHRISTISTKVNHHSHQRKSFPTNSASQGLYTHSLQWFLSDISIVSWLALNLRNKQLISLSSIKSDVPLVIMKQKEAENEKLGSENNPRPNWKNIISQFLCIYSYFSERVPFPFKEMSFLFPLHSKLTNILFAYWLVWPLPHSSSTIQDLCALECAVLAPSCLNGFVYKTKGDWVTS